MALKISNEIKIAILSIAALTAFLFGFNYLKGKEVFSNEKKFSAIFDDASGLTPSSFVLMKGVNIGTVKTIELSKKMPGKVEVTFSVNDGIKIPSNSLGTIISPSFITSKAINILAGTSSEDLKDGATIETIKNSEMMDQIGGITEDIKKMTQNGDSLLLKKLSGTVESATGAINSVDATINNINSVVDAKTKNQLQSSIAGVQRSVNDFNILSAELAAQKAKIAAIMNSLDVFTKNLNSNNAAINGTMANINKTTELLSKADIGGTVNNLKRTTDQLAQADLSGTINNLKKTIDELNVTLGKVNSTDGTAGMLINDKKLYNDLQGSLHSLDALLGDLKSNPSRYLSFSVFGKKQKNVAPTSNGQ